MDSTAPTLVFLPGLDGTGELLGPALELDWNGLAKTHLALPDQGPQDYDSLATVLTADLPAGPLVLIAESFATGIALRLAARLADRVTALVIVSGFCASPQPSGLGWLPLRPLFAVTPPAFFLKRFLTGDDAPPALVEQLAAALRRAPSAVLAERVRVVLAMQEDECPPLPPGLPMLLLQARQDHLVPWDAQSRLERHFPDAAVEWIDGHHLLLQTRPADCRDAVVRFLAAPAPTA